MTQFGIVLQRSVHVHSLTSRLTIYPLRRHHQSVSLSTSRGLRIVGRIELIIEGVQRRFYKAMISYCSGALEHVDEETHAKIPSIGEQLATRRRSAGVTPVFALVEYDSPPLSSQSQGIDSLVIQIYSPSQFAGRGVRAAIH